MKEFLQGIVRALFDMFDAVWPLLLIVFMSVVFVFISVATGEWEKDESERHGRVHAHIIQWAKSMHVEIDGTSCRFDGGSADCDIHTKDGKREQLRCDQTGCATRGP